MILSLFGILLALLPAAQAGKIIQWDGMTIVKRSNGGAVISDSLVRNLSCDKITPDNIFTALQPDAFSAKQHIPMVNWAANRLGQCWALGLTQREYFYLLRFNAQTNEASYDADLRYMLSLAKGEDLRQNNPFLLSLTRKVIGVKDSCFSCASPERSEVFPDLEQKNFKGAVEFKQQKRFYDPSNLDLVAGNRARSQGDDLNTMRLILKENKLGRMPLLVLRAATNSQHVVLVKGVELIGPDTYQIRVYDSNQPEYDNTMVYQEQRFYAPKILLGLVNDINSPVGVFVKDQEEMNEIQKVVFQHYASVCKAVR